MRGLQADLGLVAAFGQKLGEPLRNAFTGGMVNVHASLLPRHRGAAPIAYSILSGDLTTGITTFRVGEEIDSGPILVQRQTQISKDETQEELHDRLAGIGCDALDATLKLLSDDLHYPGQVQDESLVTRAPKLKKSDGQLDFNEPARSLWLRCRAMWHWPGARCMYESQHGKQEVVTFSAVTPLPVDAGVAPGTITDTMTVATGQGSLEIHGLKPAGKREMGWKDFINGRQVQPGDRFTSLSTQGGGG
jgi:methionyl-tRNA formyltransferase